MKQCSKCKEFKDESEFNKNYRNKDWLIEQYWDKGLSLKQIGNNVNKTDTCINYWMKKYNISIRKQFVHLQLLNKNKEHQSKAGKARAKWTNKHYAHLARERLLKKNPGYIMHVKWKEKNPEDYHNHQLNAGMKGGEVRKKQMTDWDFYNKYGCFKSQYPYPKEFNKKLKQMIFKRDGGICQECHKLICDRYAIHHIDYNKENNNPENLILLCQSCHNPTNVFNHDYWKKRFSVLIFNKLKKNEIVIF